MARAIADGRETCPGSRLIGLARCDFLAGCAAAGLGRVADRDLGIAEEREVERGVVPRSRLDLQAHDHGLAGMRREIERVVDPLGLVMVAAHQFLLLSVDDQVAREGHAVALARHGHVGAHGDAEGEADGGSLGQGQGIIDPGLARRHVPGRVHEQRVAAEQAAPRLIGDAATGVEVAHPRPRHGHRRLAVGLPGNAIDADLGQGRFTRRETDRSREQVIGKSG